MAPRPRGAPRSELRRPRWETAGTGDGKGHIAASVPIFVLPVPAVSHRGLPVSRGQRHADGVPKRLGRGLTPAQPTERCGNGPRVVEGELLERPELLAAGEAQTGDQALDIVFAHAEPPGCD